MPPGSRLDPTRVQFPAPTSVSRQFHFGCDEAACQRVVEIATESAPRLTNRQGQGASAASIAHELLLLDFGNTMGPMTRQARRRQRGRLRLKSN
jgi:hypothetical protein